MYIYGNKHLWVWVWVLSLGKNDNLWKYNNLCKGWSWFVFSRYQVILIVGPIFAQTCVLWVFPSFLGLCSQRRLRLTGIGIPMINLRWSGDRFRFIMGITILRMDRMRGKREKLFYEWYYSHMISIQLHSTKINNFLHCTGPNLYAMIHFSQYGIEMSSHKINTTYNARSMQLLQLSDHQFMPFGMAGQSTIEV